MLDNKLIEKALFLTGKDFKYVGEIFQGEGWGFHRDISMEKFCYYLLSPEFIEKYVMISYQDGKWEHLCAESIGIAIFRFQSGNEQPLIDLLSKIK